MSLYRHKNGTYYREVGRSNLIFMGRDLKAGERLWWGSREVEATDDIAADEPYVVYEAVLHPEKLWMRPERLFDQPERFTPVDEAELLRRMLALEGGLRDTLAALTLLERLTLPSMAVRGEALPPELVAEHAPKVRAARALLEEAHEA